ncbi:MAG: aldo/keto reductase [Proteobacteria bacterium]|nr:aldo/keto reductase [Pseudomonadota bacterium]
MQMRPLGRSGLVTAPLVLGGNVFGWTADEPTSFALLDRFVAAGGNLVDTADVYSRWAPGHVGGESEAILGRWLAARGARARVLIATKGGWEMGPGEQGLSRQYLLRAVERSLIRLGTDTIDLYQTHRDDPEVAQDETLEALALLVRQGKVRAIGASNYSAPRLESALRTSAALGLPRFETLQPEYNLYARAGFEQDLATVCARDGLGVLPYFGLAAGFLTGKYRGETDLAQSPRGARVREMLTARGLRILAALDSVAAELRATPAQVALAWLMRRVTAPIASATSVAQLDELLGATRLALSDEADARLVAASAA